jgi:colanic acid biosynthesis glycosyl transferase WcaI
VTGTPPDLRLVPPPDAPVSGAAVGHAVVVDLDHAPDPGDQAPCSAVLADRLAQRAASVDVLDVPAPLPHRPELVVGFIPHLASAEAAARIARTAGARLIVVVQELSGPSPVGDAAAAVSVREERLLRSASSVAIASETFRDAVRQYGVPDDRIGVLPDWAHVVPTWLDRREARRALGWPERAFLAVHTGTGPHADPETVLEAARHAGPEVVTVLVGDDPRLAAAAEDLPNVLVTGPLDADLRPLTLVAADVLVLSEALAPGQLALPGDLGSCLAAARPVVAAAVPGGVTQVELDRAVGAGVVVPSGAADRLAEALLSLRADPGRRVAMGLAALAHADDQLSLRSALARFDDIVDAALTGPPVDVRA